MRIIIGADHAGWRLKEHIRRVLEEMGHEVKDIGTHGPKSVDYPDYARRVAEAVSNGEFERGVLVCATGLGMCIAANRFRQVRAVAPRTEFEAYLSRAHNDANVLCLGGRVQAAPLAEAILRRWLETTFDGGRHRRRLDKLSHPNFTGKEDSGGGNDG